MILKKEKLNSLLDMLASEATVYAPAPYKGKAAEGSSALHDRALGEDAPVLCGDQTCFAPYKAGDTVEFGGAKTDFSPKEALLPQTETLYTYSKLGEDVTIEEVVNETNQVLFGVRSCDAYSIDRMDEVFLTRTFVDTLYNERRQNTLIVALGCTAPERSCFCTSFGIDPALAQGADIQLTDIGESYFVEALTDKGLEALKKWDSFLEQGDKPEVAAVECTLVVDTSNIKESLEKMFEDPYWYDLSMKCLGCGTCAFVCPTCHCFDMNQNNKGNEGYRFRTWDSCTFTDYTLMAGNHNPRPTKMKRLRNRFMHKLSFFNERYGSSMCSGCGRCIEMCPVNIDISRVIEDAEEVAHHD